MKNWITEIRNIPPASLWKKYSQCNEECYIEFILQGIIYNSLSRSLQGIIYNSLSRSLFADRDDKFIIELGAWLFADRDDKFIIELGAWDGFHLSNTRYFIEKYGYKALLIDGDNHGNKEVKEHFITKDNIADILKQYDAPKQFDLLCIDLDGNDLYILEEILKAEYKPKLIVAEFNPIWDIDQSKVITYDPNHVWGEDDYYGFSFLAGVKMAEKYGYTCVFQNDSINMYFVENSLLMSLPDFAVLLNYQQKFDHPKSTKTDWIDY